MDANMERLIAEHNARYQMTKIAGFIFTILFIAVLVFILWKLSKTVARGVREHKAGKVAVCMTISLILFWPVAVGQGIYLLLAWRQEPPKQSDYHEPPTTRADHKPFTQADFERWKAAKEKLEDQDGYVDLDELGKLFHWGIA